MTAVLLLGFALAAPAMAAKGDPLDDERLAPVKADVEVLFERADEAGYPSAIFKAKVREGLVKNVPAKKILAALLAIEKRCAEGKKLIAASKMKASPPLVGAVAQVLALGVSSEDVAKLLGGLKTAKADKKVVDKSLLVVTMMSEGGEDGTKAVSEVLAIVDSGGLTGLDAWIVKNLKSGKASGGSAKHKTKGKSGKKKHKAKGKAPGKSHGSHGK